jgi:hypothetical protein
MMTQQPPRQRQPRQRLHPAHRALVTETCGTAALGCYLLALTAAPTWVTAALLAAAGLTVALVTVVVTAAPGLGAAVAGWAVLLPGWLAWERHAGQPYSAGTIAALAIPATVLTGLTLVAYAGLHDARRHAADHDARAAAALELGKWGRMLDALGVAGVRAVREEANRAGRDVWLLLPPTGKVTIQNLRMVTDGVQTARHLQADSVSFEQGAHAAEVIMHLDEHDVMAEELLFPADTGLLSVRDPITIGAQGDGTPAQVLMREVAAMVLGVMGAGKTNLLNVLIALLTRCPDVIVFVIDLKGGRLAAPWLMPWIDGDTPRPAVDWVATTREEAALMLRAVDNVITARGGSLSGGSKIQPTPGQPQFVVIGDEIADVFGQAPKAEQAGTSNADMAFLGSKITRKGRSEAVMPVWGTQRGVATMTGGGDIKSQCRLRFALGTASEADARSSVADDAAAARLLSRLRHPGTGIVWLPGVRKPLPVKFYRLDAENEEDVAKMHKLATAAGRHRPVPDALALEAMGDAYTRRWERSALYQMLAQDSKQAEELAQVPHPDKPVPPPPPMPQAQVADVFAEMMAAEGLAGGKPDPRGRMYAMLAGFPQAGLGVWEIGERLKRENLGVARETIHRWLREDMDATPPKILKRGEGKGARYRLPPPAQ